MEDLPQLMSKRSITNTKLSSALHETVLSNNLMFHVDFLQFLVEAYEVRLAKIEKIKLQKPVIIQSEPEIEGRSNSREWGATWWEQFSILFSRGLKERRHEYLSSTRVTQVISTAIIIGLLWWHSDASTPKRLQDQATKNIVLMVALSSILIFVNLFISFL